VPRIPPLLIHVTVGINQNIIVKNIILISLSILTVSLLASCGFIRMKKFAKTLETRSLVSKDFVQTIKFRQDSQYIYIDAKVNGDKVDREYILDTGSPTLFFTEAEDTLNLQLKRLYNFGKNNQAKYGFTNAKIGTIEYKNLSYMFLKPYWDFKQLGMLGCNTMQNTIWSFNFMDSIITISDNIEKFTNLDSYYKIKFKPRRSQETPYIQAVINKKDTVSVMIDSGDNTFIKGYDWDKNKFEIDSNNIKICKINLNLYGSNLKKDSIITRKYFRINSLNIGEYEMNNIVVDGGVYQIGLRFLKNFDITFDWINHYFYFKENGTADFPTNINSYGFKVTNNNEKLRVYMLYNDSKAAKLGMKLGDEILSINGIDAKDIDKNILDKINNKLSIDDEFIFTIKGIEKNIKLKKESLF